ncbi:NAD(P)(+) transhydrogenase (Re/Si-specific) subunit beta [Escherichia coli]
MGQLVSVWRRKVEMTEMPELVAILHSFVGLAAVLVGFNSYLHHDAGMAPILVNIHLTEVFLGIFIGAVTFTGSVVAFGKLCGKISSKPLMLPNRHKNEPGGSGRFLPAADCICSHRTASACKCWHC